MKLVQTNCPNCGANLQLNSEQKIQFCNHCGNKILLEEENKTTHHEIIDKNENIANHYFDEAKIKQLDLEEKARLERKKTNLILLLAWIASLIVFFVVSLFTMDEVNFSPFQVIAIIDLIVGIIVMRKRAKS